MQELFKDREVRGSQAMLDAQLTTELANFGVHKLGYRSGNEALTLYAQKKGGLYYASTFLNRTGTAPRFWNAFGIYDGKLHGTQKIAVEINIPLPSDKLVAGFFANNPATDETFLIHDGKVGGGKVGVSRAAFLDHSRLSLVEMTSGRRGIVIGKLGDPTLISDIERFVRAVTAFKESVDQ